MLFSSVLIHLQKVERTGLGKSLVIKVRVCHLRRRRLLRVFFEFLEAAVFVRTL